MRTSFNRKMIILFSLILLIGIVAGSIFLIFSSESSKEIIFLNINNYLQNIGNTHINNIIYHIIVLSSLLVLSLIIIGIPISIFLIFYNGFSIGFIVTSLTYIFGINGLFYGIIYVIITKLVFLFLLFIFIISLIKISKLIIDKLIKKVNSKDGIYNLMIRCLVIIGLITFLDIVLYLIGVPILNIFNFLII